MDIYTRESEIKLSDEYIDVINIIDVFERLSEYGCDDEKTLDIALDALDELDKGTPFVYIPCNGRTAVIRKKNGVLEIMLV